MPACERAAPQFDEFAFDMRLRDAIPRLGGCSTAEVLMRPRMVVERTELDQAMREFVVHDHDAFDRLFERAEESLDAPVPPWTRDLCQ